MSYLEKLMLATTLILVGSVGQAKEWFAGENLLSHFNPEHALHAEYEAYEKMEPGWVSRLWKHKDLENTDTFTVNIVTSRRANLKKFRASQDAPAIHACVKFDSELLSSEKVNGYKSTYWRTTCSTEGEQISTLQLAIAGRDSLYHLRKLWRFSPPEENVSIWKQIMVATSVCDTRRKKQACPGDFEKVEAGQQSKK